LPQSDEGDGFPLDAERAVLAAMMLEREAIERVRRTLNASDFYRNAHGKMFAAMLSLHERAEPVDFVTVCEELHRRGELALVGGPAIVSSVFELATCTVNAEAHARIVTAAANKRAIRRLGLDLQAWAEDPALGGHAILERLGPRLRAIAAATGSARPSELRHAR
jgi:replicative DNA helicase